MPSPTNKQAAWSGMSSWWKNETPQTNHSLMIKRLGIYTAQLLMYSAFVNLLHLFTDLRCWNRLWSIKTENKQQPSRKKYANIVHEKDVAGSHWKFTKFRMLQSPLLNFPPGFWAAGLPDPVFQVEPMHLEFFTVLLFCVYVCVCIHLYHCVCEVCCSFPYLLFICISPLLCGLLFVHW